MCSRAPPGTLRAEIHSHLFLNPSPQVGLKRTGRRCTAEGCRGALHDMVLDWDDALPVEDLWQTGALEGARE